MLGLLKNLGRTAPAALNSLARTGGTRAVNFLDDFIRAQLTAGARKAGPSVRKQANKPGLTGFLGEARLAGATPLFQGTAGTVGGIQAAAAGTLAADQTGLTGQIQNTLNQAGPTLDRFFGAVAPQSVQKLGRDMEKYGWGGIGGIVPGEYRGESQAAPERARGTQAILNGQPVYWTGKKYGWQTGPSAAKAGLFGTEVVGDDAFASVGGLAPPAPALPSPSLGGGFVRQAGQLTSPAPSFGGTGGMSNGAGVPALRNNVQERTLSQEVLNAAQQYSAPAGVSLPSFYQGQQQLGRSMEQTGELQRQLQELGGAAGMNNDALMQWAQANPGLAYRELQKLKSRSNR